MTVEQIETRDKTLVKDIYMSLKLMAIMFYDTAKMKFKAISRFRHQY